jgi:TRAP-type uncharacterized transport system fused permease subunit
MFAFYFAILSSITPPVALAVLAAAGLAKYEQWASGWAAVKIGAAGFIVPFMFVYEPALLMIDESWLWIVWRFLCASVGIMLFAAGLHGFLLTHASLWQRGLLIAGGFALVVPALWTDVAGALLGAVVIGAQMIGRRPARKSAQAAE